MDVMILAGGLSHERDVSVRSGRRVLEELKSAGHKVSLRDVDSSLIPSLRGLGEAVVWPLLHGASGEDGSLQALLELVGVPFVGTGSREARVAWTKPVAKAVMARAGLATPDFVTLPQSLFREMGAEHVLEAIAARFDFPLVVKPAQGGSALGITLVQSREDLSRAMVHCFAYGDMALIEKAVEGNDLAISIVGTGDDARALPAVEIVCEGPYDYDARYNPGRVQYYAPARLSETQADAVSEAALTAHRTLGLRDLSRVDMLLDGDGVPQLLEVNIAPGMTETSLFPQAVGASGSTLAEVYGEIAGMALARA